MELTLDHEAVKRDAHFRGYAVRTCDERWCYEDPLPMGMVEFTVREAERFLVIDRYLPLGQKARVV